MSVVLVVASGRAPEARAFTTAAAGYNCADSEEASGPAFAWDDIAATGTSVIATGTDDLTASVPIPWTFTYMGVGYTELSVCSNGWAQFGPTTTAEFFNETIPTAGTPNAAVMVFWDDLHTGPASGATTGGSVVSSVLGTAPNRRLVVSWNNVTFFPSGSNPHTLTFQLALFEQGHSIRCQYSSMNDNGGALRASGEDATVGIENTGGTDGILYEFGSGTAAAPATNNIYSNLAIGYWPMGSTPGWTTGGGGGGGGGGGNPGGASRENDNGNQGINDLFCANGAAAAANLSWIGLLLAVMFIGVRRRGSA